MFPAAASTESSPPRYSPGSSLSAIRAKANREKEEILAEASKQAEITRGRADAEAARVYAQAYSQDPEFYEFMRTLEAYEQTFDEKTVAILSADSEFLQLLNRAADLGGKEAMEQRLERPATTTRPAGSE